MRHLFVPACVCLMTLSGATRTDPKSTLDNFTGVTVAKKRENGQDSSTLTRKAAEPEAWPAILAANRRAMDATRGGQIAAIDVPAQSDLKYFLDPLPEAEMEGPPAPPPKPVIHRTRREVCDSLASAAETNGLPTPFFIRLLLQESGFKPGVVSPAGAQGVAQFMPETAAEMGVDNPFDPLDAIPASARLLKNLFQKFGNLGLAAAAYNAGPKRIQEWLAKKGKLPEETRGYVKTITGRPAETWTEASAGISGIKLPRIAPCQQEAGLHAWNGPNEIPMPPPSPRTMVADAAKPETAAPAKGKHQTVRVAAAGSEPVMTEAPVHAAKSGRVNATIKVELAANKTKTHPSAKAKASTTPAANKTATKSAKNEKTGKSGKKPGKPLQLADVNR